MPDIHITVKNQKDTVIVSTPNPVNISMHPGIAIKEQHKSEKFTATEGQTLFTLEVNFKTDSCRVFNNGILQERDADYEETDGRGSITFLSGQDAGDKIEVMYVID